MSTISASVAARMIAAGTIVVGPGPTIEIGSFGRLQLKWKEPNVAAIYEAMDAARLADTDGYSNAERIASQLGEALQARGLESLDDLLEHFDTAFPHIDARAN